MNLHDYLTAAAESGKRSRAVALVIVGSCLVAIGAFIVAFDPHSLQFAIAAIRLPLSDVVLVAGLYFLILMVGLRLSLFRELENVKLCLREAASRGDLRDAYNLIAMGQVFTVPALDGPRRSNSLPLKIVAVLPLLILTAAICGDLRSEASGHMLASWFAFFRFALGIVIWRLALALTMQCHAITSRAERVWDDHRMEVGHR